MHVQDGGGDEGDQEGHNHNNDPAGSLKRET
jgi:hypothetical protein